MTLDGHASVLVCAGSQAIRRVLVAFDGSPEAERAMALLERLPFRAPPEIVVVTVAEPAGSGCLTWARTGGPWTHLQHEAEDVARAIAGEAAGRVRARALQIDIRTPAGRPAEWLPILAAEVGADLIVVGTRGLGARQRRRLGSVTESLCNGCPPASWWPAPHLSQTGADRAPAAGRRRAGQAGLGGAGTLSRTEGPTLL